MTDRRHRQFVDDLPRLTDRLINKQLDMSEFHYIFYESQNGVEVFLPHRFKAFMEYLNETHKNKLELLLEYAIDEYAIDETIYNTENVVKSINILLVAGVNLTVKDSKGIIPIERLAEIVTNQKTKTDMSDIFYKTINNESNSQPNRFSEFIDYFKKNNKSTLKLLLNETDAKGTNLICLGILDRKDSTYIKALLDITKPDTTEKWFKVNALNSGETALHYAIYYCNYFRMNPTVNETDDKKDMENMKKIIKILLEAGADPMVKDYKGNTPIESACINGDTETVKLLKSKYTAANLNKLKFDVNTTCSSILHRTASRMKRFFKGKSTPAESTPVNGGSKRKRKTKKSRRVKSMKKRK